MIIQHTTNEYNGDPISFSMYHDHLVKVSVFVVTFGYKYHNEAHPLLESMFI